MDAVLQQVLVGVIVLGAAAVVVRRVTHALRPPKGGEGCPSCASGSPCADRADEQAAPRA